MDGDFSDEEAYDRGLIDEQGFTTFDPDAVYVTPKDTEGIDAGMELAELQLSQERSVLDQRKTSCNFNITTLRYLRGFARHYNQYGNLSDKQKNIIETNWKGGWKQFIVDVVENDIEVKLNALIETGEIL